MNTAVALLTATAAIVMLFVFKKTGCFIKSFFTSIIGGVGSLCAVGALSYFIPLCVGINPFTLFFCSVFSVPGTILLLLLKAFLI